MKHYSHIRQEVLELLKHFPEGLNQYKIYDMLKHKGVRETTFTRYLRYFREEGIVDVYYVKTRFSRSAYYKLPCGCITKKETLLDKFFNLFA